MRKYKSVKKTIKEQHLSKVICNKCNEVFFEPKKNMNYEGLFVSVDFGYESSYFGDTVAIEFDVCEKCLKEFVDTFKVKPKIDCGLFSKDSFEWNEFYKKE